MANEIYHRSNWGNAVNDNYWADVYEKYSATNKMFIRSDYYENSNVTDKLMADIYPKPSILLTPTAYDNGSLHSVKPVKTLGDELITNGTFDTDSDWTKGTGWSISGGTANYNDSANASLYQNITLNANSYELKFSISNSSGSGARIWIGTSTGSVSYTDNTYQYYTNGDYTLTINVPSNQTTFAFWGNVGGSSFSIDSVSIKEITEADFDFTRGSSATRVNEKGLIEDVQILSGNLVQNGDFSEEGSEQIVNGDFSTDSNWAKGTGWSITGGKAISDGTSGSHNLTQGGAVTVGKTYKITITVSDYVSGNVQVSAGAEPRGTMTANGTYTFYQYATPANSFYIIANSFEGSIDNVSVKEVGQNWDFTDGATITDNGVRIVSDGAYQRATQYNILTVGKNYKVQYEIVENNSGNLKMSSSFGLTPIPSTVGTHTINGQALQTFLTIERSGACDITITNISVIEITDDTDLPRINYTNFDYENGEVVPYSGTGSLLLEPQSTNLIPYSNLNFGTSSVPYGWIVGFGTGTYSHTPTTYKGQPAVIHRQETTGRSYLRVLFTGTNAEHTIRVEFDRSRCLNMEDSDPIIATIGVTNYESKYWSDVDANGVLEFQTTFGADASGELRIGLGVIDNAGVNKTLVWGMPQIELGSYATSYIPTSGSTVTRLADVCNNSGSSDLINSTEGVLYAEIAALADDQTSRVITLSDGTTNNEIRLYFNAGSSNQIVAFLNLSGTYQCVLVYTSSDITQQSKIAFKYKQNDFSLYIDGVERATDTSGNTFSSNTLNKLSFAGATNLNNFYGKTKCVAVFKEALDNDQLERLTGEGYETFKLLAQANNYTII